MHGEGKLVYKNGDVYEGSFQNDVIDGYGNYYAIDGSCYSGDWI